MEETKTPDSPVATEATLGPEIGAATARELSDRKVLSKMDWNLMPLFFVLYMLSSIDRGNIGNAEIAGMPNDLHLDDYQYNWLVTIFYIPYIIFEFSLLFWKIFPPHLVGTTVVFFWGLMATLQSATVNFNGMMALRFFLGIFEAAYAPGIIYLLSFFYLRHEVGFRVGIFASAAPLASTFSGALAYGITSGHPALASWRLLFLVEGIPTMCLAIFTYFFIPDSPDQARFLDAEEKETVKARAIHQAGKVKRTGGINLNDLGAVLLDLKAWVNALMYFSANVSYASLPVFLPTIIKEMGFSAINAQGLSAPPSFIAFLCAMITTWIADRTQQRGLMLFVTSIIGGIGYIVLATVDTVGVRYFATFLASAGVFSTIPNILAWTINNQGSDTRRGGALVLINIVGQCGPILGTRMYPASQGPRYVTGTSVCAAFMFFSAILSVLLRLLLARQNKELDRQYKGKSGSESDLKAGAEDYGPSFRYAL